MVTVLRAEGFRVVIFMNDHEPAHVHVFGDGELKIDLGAIGSAPRLVWADGMPTSGAPCESRPACRRYYWKDRSRFMAIPTDREIEAALARGAKTRASEPRAASVRYDRASKRVAVELTNGCAFVFPPAAAQGLEHATPTQLAQVEILGAGSGLHWEALDVDLSVPALLSGIFGTRAWQASQAGRTRSVTKAAAARANGAKGGRPKKKAS